MKRLIIRILVRLGLRLTPRKYDPPTWTGNVGWKWYGGYGRVKSNDWIIFGDIAEGKEDE